MSTIGSWGLHTQVQPRFGARAIVERSGVSLLWDRSGVYGEADEQWITDIDTVLPGFIERLSKLFQQGELLSDQDKLVTLAWPIHGPAMAISILMSTGKKAVVFKPRSHKTDTEGEHVAHPLPETSFFG